jgi:AbrB family looped-hinge helix DNA binding protein
MTKATISSKGQIAIPKTVRERLNLKAGTEISIDVQGEALVMKRLAGEAAWRTMQGMARGGESLTQALEAEHRAELAREDARTLLPLIATRYAPKYSRYRLHSF